MAMRLPAYILSLDVGFRNMGYAIWSITQGEFVSAGCITTDKEFGSTVARSNILRCQLLSARLETIIGRRPARLIVGEFPHGGARNARAATGMALATAVVATFARLQGIDLKAVTPNDVKRMVNPKPRAIVEKEEVIAYAIRRFGSRLLPDNSLREHVADAMVALDFYLNKP